MAYGTDEGFVDYHEARGRTVPASWVLPGATVIQSARLVASEWLDASYGGVWIGEPTDGFTQDRQWPRTGATTQGYTFPDDITPERVINAAYEAAWQQATKPGAFQTVFNPQKYTSVSIDGAVSIDYNLNMTSVADMQVQLQVVEQLMQPLIDPNKSGSFSGLSGAKVLV